MRNVNRATRQARKYANQAADMVHDQYENVAGQIEAGYEGAQDLVRARPMQSAGVIFGLGLLAGALINMFVCTSQE